jgi:transglutaminase/protease-like cytokinesis protein 3
MLSVFTLSSCSQPSGVAVAGTPEASQGTTIDVDEGGNVDPDWPSPQIVLEDEEVPLAWGVTTIKTPTNPGTVVYENSKAKIDASNVAEGYIMVSYTGTIPKIKVQVTKSGSQTTYTYDLNPLGRPETYPITEGSGLYTVRVLENISGSSYALALSQDITVNLTNSFLPFLYPNQYVNFDANSQAVKKAAELATGAESDIDVIKRVYEFVVANVTYDHEKAATVQSGYLPVVDTTLATGKGICFDYAALMGAMLRSQGIPTKLSIGYVSGGIYHAWISTYVTNVGWINSMIYFDGTDWKLMDPTFAANSGNSKSINEFIGKGSNYVEKYAH